MYKSIYLNNKQLNSNIEIFWNDNFWVLWNVDYFLVVSKKVHFIILFFQ